MVGAETSYMAGGNFFDMEEGIPGQNHLKPRETGVREHELRVGQPWRMGNRCSCRGMSKVCQCAHMKSFSLFYRRMYVGMGSLGEHGCSRINLTGGVSDVYLKQFLASDMSEKCFFLRVFSLKLIVRIFLAAVRVFSFNL